MIREKFPRTAVDGRVNVTRTYPYFSGTCATRLALLCTGLAAAPMTGCSGDNRDTQRGGVGTAPAVMVAVQARSPESSSFYVGVYPELPRAVDLAGMLEVPSGRDARAFGGYVFVWDAEASTYTRFSVDDSLNLYEDGAVSFANLGASGSVMTSFISATRAYSLTRNNMQIVVWNPTTMELLGSISTDAVPDPDYPDLDIGEPARFGDHVAWPVLWYDYDNLRFKPELGVILAAAGTEDAAFVERDSRCGGGWSLFTDSAGDLYVTGNAWFGFAHFFGDEAPFQPNDCVLRMKSGSTAFDPEYYVDLNQAANTPAVYHTWQSTGRGVVAAVWDPADDPGTLSDPDEYWSAPMLRKVVQIDDGVATELHGIPKSAVFSTLDYRLDGELYMLVSEGSPDPGANARSSLYRIAGSEAVLAFSTTGDIWSIGRVR
jgi:hypothetical protein